MNQLNKREKRWISILLSSFGIFLIISGIIMNNNFKPLVKTKMTVTVEKRKIAASQAKSNEIKIKDIEIEVNNPISTDVKQYIEDINNLDENTINQLRLDTSLVNINEAGTYQYKIHYKKNEFIGKITVKKKELPNMLLTLKTIKLNTNDTLSQNPRTFINEEISDEVYNHLTLNISEVDTTVQGDYTYYIIYKDITYQGKVEIRDPAPTIIVANKITCPEDAEKKGDTCTCKDPDKVYFKNTNTCK